MRALIKILLELEYELNPANYPGEATPEEMLSIDLADAEDNPFKALDAADKGRLTVSGELLPGATT